VRPRTHGASAASRARSARRRRGRPGARQTLNPSARACSRAPLPMLCTRSSSGLSPRAPTAATGRPSASAARSPSLGSGGTRRRASTSFSRRPAILLLDRLNFGSSPCSLPFAPGRPKRIPPGKARGLMESSWLTDAITSRRTGHRAPPHPRRRTATAPTAAAARPPPKPPPPPPGRGSRGLASLTVRSRRRGLAVHGVDGVVGLLIVGHLGRSEALGSVPVCGPSRWTPRRPAVAARRRRGASLVRLEREVAT